MEKDGKMGSSFHGNFGIYKEILAIGGKSFSDMQISQKLWIIWFLFCETTIQSSPMRLGTS